MKNAATMSDEELTTALKDAAEAEKPAEEETVVQEEVANDKKVDSGKKEGEDPKDPKGGDAAADPTVQKPADKVEKTPEEIAAEQKKEKDALIKRIVDKDNFSKVQKEEMEALESLSPEDLRKVLDEKDKIVGRQALELGRKRKEAAKRALEEASAVDEAKIEEINETFHDNPAKKIEEMTKEAIERERKKAEAQLQYDAAAAQEAALENQMEVNELMPDFETYLDEICDIIREDSKAGKTRVPVSEEHLKSFKAFPYSTPPHLLFSFVNRVNLKRMEQLKSKTRIDNDAIVSKIERVAATKPAIKAGGGSQAVKTKTVFDPSRATEYSDAEIEAMLKESQNA